MKFNRIGILSPGISEHCCPAFLLPFSPPGIELLPYSSSSFRRPADPSLSANQELILLPSPKTLPAPWCSLYISSVQSLSHVQLFAISCGAACQVSLSITNSHSLLKLMFIKLVIPPNNFIFYLPACLLPLNFLCIRAISNESVLLINWPKYWKFSFSNGPSKVYSGQISFRIDWLDLLAVQGTLKSLLQHHSSKASILFAQLSLWSNSHIQSRLLAKP